MSQEPLQIKNIQVFNLQVSSFDIASSSIDVFELTELLNREIRILQLDTGNLSMSPCINHGINFNRSVRVTN